MSENEAVSFDKAAEQLFISLPAVIKQINALEANRDLQLFHRTHRGLVVTKAGQSLYQDATYIIGYCKDSVKRAKDAMENAQEVIRDGISLMVPPQVFVDLWPKIQKLYPDMKFQLVPFENTVENVRQNTDNGKTDRTDEDDIIKNLCQVITCRLAGSDTGNKSALLLHVVRYHQRIEGNGGIEVSKEDNQYDVY